MKTARVARAGAALALACFAIGSAPVSPPATQERLPAVAGQFYPGDRKALETAIETYLSDALPPRPERPLALIVPHAGYHYSGQIAADAARAMQRARRNL